MKRWNFLATTSLMVVVSLALFPSAAYSASSIDSVRGGLPQVSEASDSLDESGSDVETFTLNATSDLKTFNVKGDAVARVTALSTAEGREETVELEFGMADSLYDRVAYSSVVDGSLTDVETAIRDNGTFTVTLKNTTTAQSFEDGIPLDMRFHTSVSDSWVGRQVTAELEAGALSITGDEISSETVQKMIESLTFDPWRITALDAGNVALVEMAYEALPESDQEALDSLKYRTQTYGRALQQANWALKALDELDSSTSLADGTYTGKVAFESSMGKSLSARAKKFLVEKVVVQDSQATAHLKFEGTSADMVLTGGRVYRHVNSDEEEPSEFEVPIKLNVPLYLVMLAKKPTTSTVGITYQVTTSVDEQSVEPDDDDDASQGKDQDSDGSGGSKAGGGTGDSGSEGTGGSGDGDPGDQGADGSGDENSDGQGAADSDRGGTGAKDGVGGESGHHDSGDNRTGGGKLGQEKPDDSEDGKSSEESNSGDENPGGQKPGTGNGSNVESESVVDGAGGSGEGGEQGRSNGVDEKGRDGDNSGQPEGDDANVKREDRNGSSEIVNSNGGGNDDSFSSQSAEAARLASIGGDSDSRQRVSAQPNQVIKGQAAQQARSVPSASAAANAMRTSSVSSKGSVTNSVPLAANADSSQARADSASNEDDDSRSGELSAGEIFALVVTLVVCPLVILILGAAAFMLWFARHEVQAALPSVTKW